MRRWPHGKTHLLAKRLPLFFYGQAYGFSLIECLAIVPFYAIAVKLAMLCLWITGVVFLFKAFLRINNDNTVLPFLLILLLICCPAWAVWSMKARGGYLTAFMLTSVIFYLLFSGSKFSFLRYIITGLLVTLVYQSQLLWIPGLMAIIICRLYKEMSVKKLLAFSITAILFFIFFYCYKQGLPHYYTPGYSFASAQLAGHIPRIPYYLFSSLHGYYFSSRVQQPNFFSAVFAYIFAAIIFLLIVVAIANLVTRKKGTALFNVSVLAIVLTLCCTLVFQEVSPRYLLPITGYTLLSLLLLLQSGGRKVFYVTAAVLIITGVFSLISFKDFRFSTVRKSNTGQLITYLLSKDVHYVFCYDRLLTYQLLFYSKEQIIARDRPLIARFPLYTQQVDSALNNGLKTAFIFNELQIRDTAIKSTSFNGYQIIFDPSRIELEKYFQLK